MSYNSNIPLATDNLSVSQGDIKTNFLVNNTCIGVDHIPPTIASQTGYHKQVHLIKGSDPAFVADTDILYAKDYTPDATGATVDTQLFNITATGIISQMSGKLTGQDGWCWIGGILMQWGRVTVNTGAGGSTHRDGTVTFKDRVPGAIPFPNSCFVVTTNLTCSSATQTSPSSTTVSIFSKSTTTFRWNFNTTANITDNPQFYWVALGN